MLDIYVRFSLVGQVLRFPWWDLLCVGLLWSN
jgi:hypothetical protein